MDAKMQSLAGRSGSGGVDCGKRPGLHALTLISHVVWLRMRANPEPMKSLSWKAVPRKIINPVLLGAGVSVCVCLGVLGVLGLGHAADSALVQEKATKGIGSKTVNVLVINFDPVLKTRNGLKLHEYMKWSDPWKLTDKMVEDARVTSQGYVDYRVVEKIEYDGFTTFRNGFTYTEEEFLRMWEKDRKSANQGMTSFKWMFEKFDLAAKIKAKNITEIWLWGAPYMQWDELHWKTPGDKIPYQTDNPVVLQAVRHPGCGQDDLDHGLELRTGGRRDAGELLSPD